jgi:hypothetical protein
MDQLADQPWQQQECGKDSHLPRVKEWLDYHVMVGIDHFYFYDHRSALITTVIVSLDVQS